MQVIDFSTMSVEPVGLKDRHGVVWRADPILSTLDAMWLMSLKDSQLADEAAVKRLAELVHNCVSAYEDCTVNDLLKAFRPTDLLGILQAFLAHSGLLASSTPAPETPTPKATKTSSKRSRTGSAKPS